MSDANLLEESQGELIAHSAALPHQSQRLTLVVKCCQYRWEELEACLARPNQATRIKHGLHLRTLTSSIKNVTSFDSFCVHVYACWKFMSKEIINRWTIICARVRVDKWLEATSLVSQVKNASKDAPVVNMLHDFVRILHTLVKSLKKPALPARWYHPAWMAEHVIEQNTYSCIFCPCFVARLDFVFRFNFWLFIWRT
jgi:hypothetical protein